MNSENNIYVVLGGNTQIWIVNPGSKQMLRLKPAKDKSKILDLYACDTGIYQATKLVKYDCKKVQDYIKRFPINYVQIIDSLSSKPCMTLTPQGIELLPLEERLVELNFQFHKKENSLLYVLNDVEGVIFQKFNGEMEQSGKINFNKKEMFYGGRRIATIDETIKYAKEIDAAKFAKQLRIKNKDKYKRNKDFLR